MQRRGEDHGQDRKVHAKVSYKRSHMKDLVDFQENCDLNRIFISYAELQNEVLIHLLLLTMPSTKLKTYKVWRGEI